MKLKITAGQLKKAIEGIWPSVDTFIQGEARYFKPILMKAEKGNFKLLAESQLTFSMIEIEADIEKEGEVVISGGVLKDISKVIDNDSIIDIEFQDDSTAMSVKLTEGKNEWEINSAANPDSICAFDVGEDFTFKFDLPTFKDMMSEAAPATGRSDAGDFESPFQWGAIEIKRELYEDDKLDVIRAATTDGHRIHIIEAEITKEINVGTGDFDILDDRGVLVSKSIVKTLASLPEDEEIVEVSFGMNKTYMILRAGGVTHGVRLLDGKFPPYEKIVQKVEPIGSVKTDRKELTKAIRSARIVKRETINIKTVAESMFPVVVSAINKIEGSKKNETSYREIEGVCEGDHFDIKVDPSYMMDSLGAIPDTKEVELIFTGEKSPLIVKHPERYFRSFIMPLEGG